MITNSGAPLSFMGIGAQKAGTTWLWQVLKGHPDVWMPPIKEIHYFDRDPEYPLGGIWLSEPYLIRRLLDRQLRERTIGGVRWALSCLRRGDQDTFTWLLRYFLGTYNDSWYCSLFRSGEGKLVGEITPDYSILSKPDVLRIRQLFPSLKVIFILRNPIDRAWSHVRYDWTASEWTDTFVTDISDLKRVKAFIDSPGQELHSNYVRTLQIWRSIFPQSQFFIGFFEDIVLRPSWFYYNICNFLGIEAIEQCQLERKFNVSKKSKMPNEIELYLSQKYLDDLVQLSQIFGGYVGDWLASAKAILQSSETVTG